MANTLGGVNTAIIESAGVAAFKAALAPVRALSLNVDSTPAQKGESITTNVITGMSAGAFSSTYESGDTTTTAKTVTLGTHIHRAFHISDIEGMKATADVVASQAAEAAYAVGKLAFQNVTDLLVAATYGDTATDKITVAVASFDADDVVDLADLMDDADIPETNRSLILTNAGNTALRKDNALQDASASGDALTLREGSVGRISGFDVFRTNALTSTITDQNTYGIGIHPSALAVAIRPVMPADNAEAAGLYHSVVTDPETGISLSYREWYNTATGIKWGTFTCLMGVVACQTTGAKRVVSA